MQTISGINTNKYINHFKVEELKFMETLMIKYLYHSVDLYILSTM
jgi:hypothetical protein